MAYVDPDGLFDGDRFSRISDEARIMWAFFWCASNTCGRLELSYRKVLGRAFHRFKQPPAEAQFWAWIEEYWKAHLLFIYESDGQMWGQWDIPNPKWLPKYKLTKDERTPPPDIKELADWKNSYLAFKKSAGAPKFFTGKDKHQTSKTFQNPAEISAQNATDKEMELEVEKELEEDKTLPADAGEMPSIDDPPFGTVEPGELFVVDKPIPEISIDDQLADAYAPKIYNRHPKRRRDIGVIGVRLKLKAILRKFPKAERPAVAQQIDHRHEGWCASENWQKDDGEYAKSLDNWLAPTKDRWNADPPARASPGGTLSRAAQLLVKNLHIEGKV